MSDNEVWKSVVDYEGFYDVSNQGSVFSHQRKFCKGGLLKAVDCGNGYFVVCLCKGSKQKNKTLHTIVWEAFNGKIPKGYDVHHKNHNKSDNRLENLELIERCEHRKVHQKQILQYTLDNEFITEYESLTEAAKQTNSNPSAISQCCLGKRKSHNCFKWKYKEVA